MPSLLDMPDEIVLWIHFLAESASLPLTHPTLYRALHYSPTSYKAQYLLSLYHIQPPSLILPFCLRHPVCDVAVAKGIARRCPPLSCPSLPVRIFRARGGDPNVSSVGTSNTRLVRDSCNTGVPPLVSYLMDTYHPSPNIPNGYPLSRAVLSSNTVLIRYLLEHGAHPGVGGGLAVRTAVQMRRLDLVKLLVEPDVPMGGKRQRCEDRYKAGSELVELAMGSGADDIVQYFVGKGVLPPLRSIMAIGSKRIRRR